MPPRSGRFVALLRGVNVTGRNKIPMAELRQVAEGLGWENAATFIQSGNLVFNAKGKPAALEAELEAAISKRFKLTIPTIVRTAKEWSGYVASNPFEEASRKEPNLVLLALSKSEPKAHAVERLLERAAHHERIERAGDALWIHFAGGVGKSKLAPALLDRMVGSTVTARNWRTVQEIARMAAD